MLKNLLANAFKFTERGEVTVRMGRPGGGWRPANDALSRRRSVIAFSITDTGIGIAPEQQQLIFEAFAQADGTAARQYGGTGLGLSISRELVGLLGGEIRLDSTLGVGSTFTVYLPVGSPVGDYDPDPRDRHHLRRARSRRRRPLPPARSMTRNRELRPAQLPTGGQEGSGRRRRHPQHLCGHRASGTGRCRGPLGRERRGGDRR